MLLLSQASLAVVEPGETGSEGADMGKPGTQLCPFSPGDGFQGAFYSKEKLKHLNLKYFDFLLVAVMHV